MIDVPGRRRADTDDPGRGRLLYAAPASCHISLNFDVLLETMVELQRTMAPHLHIALDIHEGILEGSLGQTGREILRIIGEALTNTRRHSEAKNVWVRVGISQGILFGEVEDDARGFDPTQEEPTPPATTGGGVGMRSMRERANHLGGELKTQSEPAKGTKVRFELVLQRARGT